MYVHTFQSVPNTY